MSLEMFTSSDITKAICRSCDKNEKLRLQSLLLVKNGLSPAKVAEDFSVHRSTVHRWMKQAEEECLLSLNVNLKGNKVFFICKTNFRVKTSILKANTNRGWLFSLMANKRCSSICQR